jgi:hypothetical protein
MNILYIMLLLQKYTVLQELYMKAKQYTLWNSNEKVSCY